MGFFRRRESPWLGMAAGLVGGLAGSIAIGQFLQFWSKVTQRDRILEEGTRSTTDAAQAVSRNVFHHELREQEKPRAAALMHYGFGGAMGALYGLTKAMAPHTPTGLGSLFGATVYLGAHAAAVPALGLSEPVYRKPMLDEAGELIGHAVYGAVTELTRRGVLAAARAI